MALASVSSSLTARCTVTRSGDGQAPGDRGSTGDLPEWVLQ